MDIIENISIFWLPVWEDIFRHSSIFFFIINFVFRFALSMHCFAPILCMYVWKYLGSFSSLLETLKYWYLRHWKQSVRFWCWRQRAKRQGHISWVLGVLYTPSLNYCKCYTNTSFFSFHLLKGFCPHLFDNSVKAYYYMYCVIFILILFRNKLLFLLINIF